MRLTETYSVGAPKVQRMAIRHYSIGALKTQRLVHRQGRLKCGGRSPPRLTWLGDMASCHGAIPT
jgi:hypothetical protein